MGITLCYNEKKGKIMCERGNKNIAGCLITIFRNYSVVFLPLIPRILTNDILLVVISEIRGKKNSPCEFKNHF
jgi:hypothetical protein